MVLSVLIGQDDSYDFGSGAGFYVNATEEPWAKHYQMYDYVTRELPALINSLFPVDSNRKSICGHSMGGHGALICHLKNPGSYTSVKVHWQPNLLTIHRDPAIFGDWALQAYRKLRKRKLRLM